MEIYFAILWFGVLVASVMVEATTAALVAIWFMPSAIVSLILALFKVEISVQILIFFVLSAILILLSRMILKKAGISHHVPTNADAIIGQKAIVVEAIDNIAAKGQVKVCGQTWSARSLDENVKYNEGEVLVVVAIEGVKLICKNI